MAHGDANGARLYPERLRRGETSENAKLTEQIVCEIRTRYAAGGISQAALAAEYGIRQTQVSNVILRKSWAHID
jgi:predicted XRE-type DNA-binding protein